MLTRCSNFLPILEPEREVIGRQPFNNDFSLSLPIRLLVNGWWRFFLVTSQDKHQASIPHARVVRNCMYLGVFYLCRTIISQQCTSVRQQISLQCDIPQQL